jgi:Pyruvate/2-oxoacid:ferredoxin oxidoreductase delta subunit
MPKKNINYKPNEEQMLLWPKVSGNKINGLDELSFRRPDYVYWRDPEQIVYGELQKWFYKQNTDKKLQEGRNDRIIEEAISIPEISQTVVIKSPEEWSSDIKRKAIELGVDAVGITKLELDWTYEGVNVSYDTIIVLGLAMNYEEMLEAPKVSAGAHVVKEYTRGMKASKKLAGWLRLNGHDALPEHGPFAGDLPLIPAAIAAGLGELGKHGSVINSEMGSCFRLAAVMTNMKLKYDTNNSFGVDDFCKNCQICSNYCPPDAILHEKKTVRGEKKWYVDFDKCLPFFNETAGCGICITVCPFSRPDVRPNLISKLQRKRNKLQ